MSELRALRRSLGLSQQQFASRLSVPTETFRTWDSGRRPTPAPVLQRAKHMVASYVDDRQLLPLKQLATEFRVHVRTLQAAANTGKLPVHFSQRSAFGRPIQYATRKDVQRFKSAGYGRSGGPKTNVAPLPRVPADYDARLKYLRRCLELSQELLAQRVGAAGKAVVYQWESRKRRPSPVFWQRIEKLYGPVTRQQI